VTTQTRRLAVAVLGVVVAALTAGCAPEPGSPSDPGASWTPTPSSSSVSSPSLDAAPDPSSPPAPSPSSSPAADSGSADVTIVTADVERDGLEVTGQVLGQSDPEATCTLTASRGDVVRSVEVTVTVSGANSFCPLMVVPRNRLSAGVWDIVIGYRGTRAAGDSGPLTMEVS
jgi:hypothetical protein